MSAIAPLQQAVAQIFPTRATLRVRFVIGESLPEQL
jgi:hypothetical protein